MKRQSIPFFSALRNIWYRICPKWAESFDSFITESEKVQPKRTFEIRLKKINTGYIDTDRFSSDGPWSYQYYFIARAASSEKNSRDVLWTECIGKPVMVLQGEPTHTTDAEKEALEAVNEIADDIRKKFREDKIIIIPVKDIFADTAD